MEESLIGNSAQFLRKGDFRDYQHDGGATSFDIQLPGLGKTREEQNRNLSQALSGLRARSSLPIDAGVQTLLYTDAFPSAEQVAGTDMLSTLSGRIRELVRMGRLAGVRAFSDGAGSTGGAEYASALALYGYYHAVATLVEQGYAVDQKTARLASHYANDLVASWNEMNHKDSAATLVTSLLDRQSNNYVTWIGDSRGYVWQQNQDPVQITSDHSVLWQSLIAGGDPFDFHNFDERSVITKAIGDRQSVADVLVIPAQDTPYTFLLVGDGVWEGIDLSQHGKEIAQFRDEFDRIVEPSIEIPHCV